jgi:predicted choloylglycine hydrolase
MSAKYTYENCEQLEAAVRITCKTPDDSSCLCIGKIDLLDSL